MSQLKKKRKKKKKKKRKRERKRERKSPELLKEMMGWRNILQDLQLFFEVSIFCFLFFCFLFFVFCFLFFVFCFLFLFLFFCGQFVNFQQEKKSLLFLSLFFVISFLWTTLFSYFFLEGGRRARISTELFPTQSTNPISNTNAQFVQLSENMNRFQNQVRGEIEKKKMKGRKQKEEEE